MKRTFLLIVAFIWSTLSSAESLLETTPDVCHTVNVTTGWYVETKTDLLTSNHALALKRVYSSSEKEWIFNFPNIISNDSTPPNEMGNVALKYNKQTLLEEAVDKVSQASFKFNRPQSHILEITSSDGQKATYTFDKERNLVKVQTVAGEETYTYQGKRLTRREEADRQFLEILYDKDGKVKELKGPTGTQAKFSYQPRSTDVTDPLGRKKVYTFNDQNLIVAVESDAKIERMEWAEGQLRSQSLEDKQGHTLFKKLFQYDPRGLKIQETCQGNITGERDHESVTTRFTYSPEGLLLKEEKSSGKGMSFLYKDKKLKAKLTLNKGSIILRQFFIYDEQGHLTQEILDDGQTEEMSDLSQASQKVVKTYRGTDIEEAEVDLQSGAVKVIRLTKNTYSKQGKIIQQDIFGEDSKPLETICYEYDPAGRLIQRIDDGGHHEVKQWDAHSNLIYQISLEHPEGQSFKYDNAGRLVKEEKGNSYTYDAAGNRASQTDSEGNTTRFYYDEANRLVKQEEPRIDAGLPTTLFKYNAFDQIVEKTDPEGYVTKFQYNILGKPVHIEYPDGTEERYVYDLEGRLSKQISRTHMTYEFEYDAFSNLTTKRERDSQGTLVKEDRWTYKTFRLIEKEVGGIKTTYGNEPQKQVGSIENTLQIDPSKFKWKENQNIVVNALGQSVIQKTHVDSEGIKTCRTLDALKRVVKQEKWDPFGQLLETKEYAYDLAGHKTAEIVHNGNKSYVTELKWGPMGRLEAMTEAAGSPLQRKTLYHYNEEGMLSEVVKPDGVRLYYAYTPAKQIYSLSSSDGSVHYVYEYDALGHIWSVSDLVHNLKSRLNINSNHELEEEVLANGLKVGYAYDASGHKTSLKLPDNSSVRYQYDDKALRKITRVSPEQIELWSHHYKEYDLNGLLKKEELPFNLGETHFAYDQEGRLTQIQSPFIQETLQYRGKRLQSVNTQAFKYDSSLRLTEEGGRSYTYDDLGNRLSESDTPYTYDDLQRLTSKGSKKYAYDISGNMISTGSCKLSYDALNRLTEVAYESVKYQYVYDAFHRRVQKIISTKDKKEVVHYLYDGFDEIGMVDAQGVVRELKVQGLTRQKGIGGTIAIEIDGAVSIPVNDNKGSITALIDPTGMATETIEYSSFGISETPIAPWGYLGKRFDEETGFYYFGNRFYDPSVGRFIHTDPKGYIDGPNLYHFNHNNPHAYMDSYGHFAFLNTISDLISTGYNWILDANKKVLELQNWMHEVTGFDEVSKGFEDAVNSFFGKGFLVLSGYYNQPFHSGVYGANEINDKVRVSFAHGILNLRSDLQNSLQFLSTTHGSVNVHYVYRPTAGWAWDLIKAFMVSKCGYVSQEAEEIKKIWKQLIEEMGGPGNGGKIIHYAHSIGGGDTYHAFMSMSPEEQQMIDIRTFGTAAIIPNEGTYQITNYVNTLDWITMCAHPLKYYRNISGTENDMILLGSVLDGFGHAMSVEVYQTMLKTLGQAFVATYGH